MRRILSVLLENEAGSLSRVANLFSARGINIESLSVMQTPDVTMSRMTLVTYGDDHVLEQVTKQLHKLVDVVTVENLSSKNHVEREMALVKLRLREDEDLDELNKINELYHGRIADISTMCYTNEIVGTSAQISDYLLAVAQYDILEVVRSGPLGIARGERVLGIGSGQS